ncbi:MAG: 2-C-methyl-D-erythritol 4-phosphate cytidylyltransferase [Elusimicrobiaceae bacterium]|jgi:2-C-methyl-D-erythritol 4-phosphate cytidylyltransferase/2-C-methyl-D-erythritol 2,4-cyclodiphosphate synthase
MPEKTKKPINFYSAVIVAGGQGVRMGKKKQMLPLCGKPMLLYSICTFSKTPGVREIVVVTDPKYFQDCKNANTNPDCAVITVEGGETRLDSVRNGVAAVSQDAEIIAVHDGARPLVNPQVITDCIKKAAAEKAAVPAVQVKDTIKVSNQNGTLVEDTPQRAQLWAAQTPQCYQADVIRQALEKFQDEKNATDESQLVERLGIPVAIVPSDYTNIKITTPEDILIAEAFMQTKTKTVRTRTGFGFDIHRLVEGRPLIISGVNIPHPKGLLGHSDGDVVLHAACDAALGAIAAGEIGIYFPPTDLLIMGISSRVIAERTLEIIESKNAKLIALDVTIIAEQPKMMPYYEIMKRSLMEIFNLPEDSVNVKAKSYEGMGDIGKGDAIASQVVATVEIR